MWIDVWIIFLLLFFKLRISQSSFEDEFPGVVVCENEYLQSDTKREISQQLELYRNLQAKNCTHLRKNLYIKGLEDSNLVSELSFDSIKEIDGYLVIDGNHLKKLSFKNLKIIRGLKNKIVSMQDQKMINYSLVVQRNPYLTELDLRSLGSILNHNVLFDENKVLKYLPASIQWSELFVNPNQKLISIDTNTKNDLCSKECRRWNNSSRTYCWGPGEDQCQKKIRCKDDLKSHCPSCVFDNDGKAIGCCHDQCAGGCVRIDPDSCYSCKGYINDGKCVESCPSRYEGSIGGTILNKQFKYHTGSMCSKTCPKNMLPEEVYCVNKCSPNYFKNESDYCVPCYGEKCKLEEQICDMFKMQNTTENLENLRKSNLLKLKNCTRIRGYIYIDDSSFSEYGVTVPMLYENLKNVQELEGGFHYSMDTRLKNLTFLSNLKSFRAANLNPAEDMPRNKFLIAGTDLEFLGLKSLKSFNGDFLISIKNDKLCYMNFSEEIFNKKHRIKKSNNLCPGKNCHKQCSNKGCWGPGNKMCFECRLFDAQGICVSNCSLVRRFYFPQNDTRQTGSCLKCHKECLNGCIGPEPNQCVNGCRNKIQNGTCVPKCTKKFYQTDLKTCLPCDSSCVSYKGLTCTGGSAFPGPGGCTKCKIILLDSHYNIVRCVSDCPEKTFKFVKEDIYITKYFIDNFGQTCVPCHKNCAKCSGESNQKDDCKICSGFWSGNECVTECDSTNSYGNEIIDGRKVCKLCDSNCIGCRGNSSYDCVKCRSKKIYYEPGKFYCNGTCPVGMIVEPEFPSNDMVCSHKSKEEIIRTKITIGVVFAMIIIAAFVIAVIVICLRKKANAEKLEVELKSRFSNLTEPNSKDEDLWNKPPNMGRLVIVSKEDLTFEDESRPLGFGAFGYVYKGKWKIPKDEDTLLRKTGSDFYLPVAIKVIKNMGDEEIESVMQEAKMMASVSHMHCLRFIGVCLSYDKPCLISAFVKEGSLDKYLLRNKSKITSLLMLSWAEQIADGMLYLTKRNIIHRDLAARNVLVNRLECVQITDFGLAKMLESTKEKEIIIKSGKVPVRWLAIETLLEGKYSHETDVWAYGVTLWEIFTFAKVPYEDQATCDICDFVLKGGRLSQPDICSLDVYIVMINCWLESPNLRPDFQSLMKTFMDYCKNPGRYLSIQGDPYEIPTPSNIEMTNLNNPYYGDHFNFSPNTAETMLPLINPSNTIESEIKDFSQEDDRENLMSSMSDKESLPTRSNNRTSNIFKRFQDNRQTSTLTNTRSNNTPRLVALASQEEPIFRNQPLITDDDPRYVADPTDKSVKVRQPLLSSNFMRETPRFHSNISRENSTPHSASDQLEPDGYLEPIKTNNNADVDAEGYLEPVKSSNKDSLFSSDEYMVPSQPNTPRESTMNNKPGKMSNAFKQSKNYITMDDDKSLNNHFSHTLPDDEYLEPEPSRRPVNSAHN